MLSSLWLILICIVSSLVDVIIHNKSHLLPYQCHLLFSESAVFGHFKHKVLPLPVVSSGHGWDRVGAELQVYRTPPFGSGEETSPGDDMETGLTLHQYICSWELIKVDKGAKLGIWRALWKIWDILKVMRVYQNRILYEPLQCGASFYRLLCEANTHFHKSSPEHCTLVPSAWWNKSAHTWIKKCADKKKQKKNKETNNSIVYRK